jgi:hypothetical protein
MFVAHDKVTAERVTSIDPQWNGCVEQLRQWARDGRLVCPGCEQMLWLRTGELRRRHFAHRQAAECPLDKESPEVMEAKAQLYEWLMSKYPGKVALDVDLKISGWEKPADLVLSADARLQFVYFVFDRQQRHREALLRWSCDRHVQFIHTESTHDRTRKRIKLTALQRECIAWTEYDEPMTWGGGHLYFVDTRTSRLSIYRGLACVHEPNVYSWGVERTGPLQTALIRPKTGELVFAADVETRQAALREEQEREARQHEEPRKEEERKARDREERRRERERIDREFQERIRITAESAASRTVDVIPAQQKPIAPSPEPVPPPATINLQGPFRCESCGVETMEWSSASPAQGTCVCKHCTKLKWEAARNQPKK